LGGLVPIKLSPKYAHDFNVPFAVVDLRLRSLWGQRPLTATSWPTWPTRLTEAEVTDQPVLSQVWIRNLIKFDKLNISLTLWRGVFRV